MSLRTLKEFRYACLHDGKHMLEHFFTLLNFRRFCSMCNDSFYPINFDLLELKCPGGRRAA